MQLLEQREIRGGFQPDHACPECSESVSEFAVFCMSCGTLFEKPVAQSVGLFSDKTGTLLSYI